MGNNYLYRGERWKLSYGIESDYGEAPTESTTAVHSFGVFDDATLADPEFDFQPFWFQNTNNRSYSMAYKGRAKCSGSIPDIVLLNGYPIFLPIANDIDHAQVGSTAYYTHTITDTVNLSPFRVAATYLDNSSTAGAAGLTRWFVGGKVNRATYKCEEGGLLTMSLDDLAFKMPYYKDNTSAEITPWYNEYAVEQVPVLASTEPYYFSKANFSINLAKDTTVIETIKSIRNFSLEVSNNLDPKYYMTTSDEKVPYQIYEGRRDYKLGMMVDLVDYDSTSTDSFNKNDFFLDLLRQGVDTADSVFKGISLEITFSRLNDADDYIKFTIPGANFTGAVGEQGAMILRASHPIVRDSVVSTRVEMIFPTLKVVIKDKNTGAGYPI